MLREITFSHEIPVEQLSERALKSREIKIKKKKSVKVTDKNSTDSTDNKNQSTEKKMKESKNERNQRLKELQISQSFKQTQNLQKKFYAVTRGWKTGVYDDYMIVDKVIRGFKGSEYKVFYDYIEACEYCRQNQMYSSHDTKRSQINRLDQQRKKNDKKLRTLYCRSCGKPIQTKTFRNKGLCGTCLNLPKSKRGKEKIDAEKTHYENEDTAPRYIYDLLGEDKEFIKLDGSKLNPRIFFKCKRCGEDFAIKYQDLKSHAGHSCTGLLSSGEAVVNDFLNKEGITFKTQFDTLKCINPLTKHVMPYDFEIPKYKLIIEVQGEQHRKFIECFHGTEEGFEYQQQKDSIKKSFAIDQGYKFMELWYDDIQTGKYKKLILDCIKNH